MERIEPSKVLYIKLGSKGRWERGCIADGSPQGHLRIGFPQVPHTVYASGEWDEAVEKMTEYRSDRGSAKRAITQVRYFYEQGQDTLWLTFHADRLWWSFAEEEVTLLDDGSKIRQTMNGWHSTDINGKPLYKEKLSGRLLAMEGFRGTVCRVKERDYAVQKINGEIPEDVRETEEAVDQLETSVERVIQRLHWKDFELLVDLIFREAGWKRITPVGSTRKTLDIDFHSPITNETFAVQVKSRAGRKQFDAYVDKFSDMQGYARVIFVVHTPSEDLDRASGDKDVELWLPHDIARRAVQYGLVNWILDKAN